MQVVERGDEENWVLHIVPEFFAYEEGRFQPTLVTSKLAGIRDTDDVRSAHTQFRHPARAVEFGRPHQCLRTIRDGDAMIVRFGNQTKEPTLLFRQLEKHVFGDPGHDQFIPRPVGDRLRQQPQLEPCTQLGEFLLHPLQEQLVVAGHPVYVAYERNSRPRCHDSSIDHSVTNRTRNLTYRALDGLAGTDQWTLPVEYR